MADGTNNIDVGMPALNKDEAIQTSDDISPAVTNIVIKEELATAMEGDDSLHKDSHEEVLTEHQEELKHPDDGIAAQASSKTAQEESGAEKVIMENETDHQPEEALLVPEQPAEVVQELYSLPLNEDEVPETAMDQPVDLSPPVAEPVIASDTTSPEDSPDIVDWIELGFEAKSQGEYRLAAQNFTFALQSSIDNELKYLLGMELVSIYQNIGDYEQAVIIIDHLLQDIGIQSAAVVELKQQRQYIRLLADELDRLGISGTPIFEVPRFVRIKVNEKMLA
jgi:tetratricopeptide (TPR) repeat protein